MRVSVPIRFEFVRVPTVWEVTNANPAEHETPHPVMLEAMAAVGVVWPYKGAVAIGTIDWDGRPRKLDGWKCRQEFLQLPRNEKALLGFLTKVGLWQPHGADDPRATGVPYTIGGRLALSPLAPLQVDAVWNFQEDIKKAITDRERFIEFYASFVEWNDSSFDLANRAAFWNEFPVRFDLHDKFPAGVVRTIYFTELVLATIYADFIRGFHFQVCQRSDCAQAFTVETGHKRKFCTQYCGHLVSLRRKRRLAIKTKKGRKG